MNSMSNDHAVTIKRAQQKRWRYPKAMEALLAQPDRPKLHRTLEDLSEAEVAWLQARAAYVLNGHGRFGWVVPSGDGGMSDL